MASALARGLLPPYVKKTPDCAPFSIEGRLRARFRDEGSCGRARRTPRVRRRKAAPCRAVDLLTLVLARLKRHGAGAAIVFQGARPPRATDIVGVITKRAIADAVIGAYDD